MALKPRFHRVQFLLKAYEQNLLKFGLNSINQRFLDEYLQATTEGYIYTDNTTTHTDNHKKYFTKEIFNKLNSIKNEINITPTDADFQFDHLLYYFRDREYDVSYCEVVGETHCVFDLKHGFFTEKSIKPILAERFVLIYGSNKIYKEYEKLGINLFLEEFGLIGIENKDSIEQIDMIITFLKKIDIEWIRNFYINNFDKILDNKKKLINHYFEIMNNINKLL